MLYGSTCKVVVIGWCGGSACPLFVLHSGSRTYCGGGRWQLMSCAGNTMVSFQKRIKLQTSPSHDTKNEGFYLQSIHSKLRESQNNLALAWRRVVRETSGLG